MESGGHATFGYQYFELSVGLLYIHRDPEAEIFGFRIQIMIRNFAIPRECGVGA